MHIPDGTLSQTQEGLAVLAAGAVVAAAGTGLALRRLEYEEIPRTALLSAAFFVASLIHVPLGPTSTHLVLNGLVGLVLGLLAFPAVFVGLLLQAVFFGFGGLTTLGLNTATMALPAVACFYLFRRAVQSEREWMVFAGGYAAGALAIVVSAVLTAGAWQLTGRQFLIVAQVTLAANLPVVLIEGLVVGSAAVFLRRVRPEVFAAEPLPAVEVAHG